MIKVQRVEKHIINKNHQYYQMLDEFCFNAKNLYNHANYIIRQEFTQNNRWIRYNELDKLLRNDTKYPDYKNMPTAQSSQQLLKLLDKNWSSFFKAIKDWSKHKDKYLGRPKLPKYKKKNGKFVLVLTNQEVRIKDNSMLSFPKSFNGFMVKTQFLQREDFVSFNQVRFIPNQNFIVLELVYTIEIPIEVEDNSRYMSIDIGVDNLVTITNNFGENPIIVNGKGLKSINQYYNKTISHYKSIAKQFNKTDYTNKMIKLTNKRNFKILDKIHKTSRFVVNEAIKNNVSVIVIGYNKEWKQKSVLSKKVNQNFVSIPFNTLIHQIQYKSEEIGITVILTEESYTSGTSFLDNELPIKEFYNKNRRIHRGLFKSNEGKLINSDVNGSLQIMKKVFPNAYADGIEGIALYPIKVNI
jgi:putative transposase